MKKYIINDNVLNVGLSIAVMIGFVLGVIDTILYCKIFGC